MSAPALESDRSAAFAGHLLGAATAALDLAAEAGFAHAGPAPIEHDRLRFYSLRR